MIGQKGLPATWGGVEHHVEQMGARLADRGHEVTVYCRPNYAPSSRSATWRAPVEQSYRGMRLITIPSVGTKHLDAISHSAACTAHAVRDRADVIHYHGLGPGLTGVVPRLAPRVRVVLTVHGLDGERDKWGSVAQRLLRLAEVSSARIPHATIVVSQSLSDHYAQRYGRRTWCIPNGVIRPTAVDPTRLEQFGLLPRQYLLFVGRLVPEKAPDLLLEAFAALPRDVALVLAGGSSFTDGYTERVRAAAARDPRVRLPGYVFGDDLAALYAGAAGFVLPSRLEGLPLTLLEAASHGTPVVASAIPPHVEVLGSSAPGRRLVPVGDVGALTAALAQVIDGQEAERSGAEALRRDVVERFSWDAATDLVEQVYAEVQS